jgi:putative Holliday junction resolvase
MASDRGRVLALDVGASRVGVAISDPLRITAQPGPTLSRSPDALFFENLAELIQEWSVSEGVVGLPRGLKGQKGTTYEAVSGLLAQLRERWPEIVWNPWEERFTTKEAVGILKSAPKRKRKQKGLRDRIAAQLILDSYLRFHENRGG